MCAKQHYPLVSKLALPSLPIYRGSKLVARAAVGAVAPGGRVEHYALALGYSERLSEFSRFLLVSLVERVVSRVSRRKKRLGQEIEVSYYEIALVFSVDAEEINVLVVEIVSLADRVAYVVEARAV